MKRGKSSSLVTILLPALKRPWKMICNERKREEEETGREEERVLSEQEGLQAMGIL